MIKNFLYSLFVHSLVIFIIYFGFRSHQSGIVKSDEMLVSIAVSNQDVVALNKNATTHNEAKLNSNLETVPEKKDELPEKQEDQLPEPKNESLPKRGEELKNADKSANKKDKTKKEEVLKKDRQAPIAKAAPKIDDLKEIKKTEVSENNRDKKSEKPAENQILQAGSQKLASFRSTSSVSEGEDLSSSEKLNIQLQIKSCYKRSVQESRLDSKIKLFVKISISQEGFIETEIEDVIDLARYNDPSQKDYKIVIDNIRRSLELCSPLRNLPAKKYEIWKEIVLQFDPVFNK